MTPITCNACGRVVPHEPERIIAEMVDDVWVCRHAALPDDGHIPVELDGPRCGWG